MRTWEWEFGKRNYNPAYSILVVPPMESHGTKLEKKLKKNGIEIQIQNFGEDHKFIT